MLQILEGVHHDHGKPDDLAIDNSVHKNVQQPNDPGADIHPVMDDKEGKQPEYQLEEQAVIDPDRKGAAGDDNRTPCRRNQFGIGIHTVSKPVVGRRKANDFLGIQRGNDSLGRTIIGLIDGLDIQGHHRTGKAFHPPELR